MIPMVVEAVVVDLALKEREASWKEPLGVAVPADCPSVISMAPVVLAVAAGVMVID